MTSLLSVVTPGPNETRLTGNAAALVCFITDTGSLPWVAIPIVAFLLLSLIDRSISWSLRKRQVVRLFLVLALALPAFGLMNEYLVKQAVQAPRPSHRALADAGYIADLETFYAMNRTGRRARLAPLVERAAPQDAAQRLQIAPRVLTHWVHEVSSSFPSGHAWNAFLAAALFVMMGASHASRARGVLGTTFLGWALAVSWSRILLGVHGPVDVVVGAALGIITGLLVGWSVLLLVQKGTPPR